MDDFLPFSLKYTDNTIQFISPFNARVYVENINNHVSNQRDQILLLSTRIEEKDAHIRKKCAELRAMIWKG